MSYYSTILRNLRHSSSVVFKLLNYSRLANRACLFENCTLPQTIYYFCKSFVGNVLIKIKIISFANKYTFAYQMNNRISYRNFWNMYFETKVQGQPMSSGKNNSLHANWAICLLVMQEVKQYWGHKSELAPKSSRISSKQCFNNR